MASKRYDVQVKSYCFPGLCVGHNKSDFTFKKCQVCCLKNACAPNCVRTFFPPQKFGPDFESNRLMCIACISKLSAQYKNVPLDKICCPSFCFAVTVCEQTKPRFVKLVNSTSTSRMHECCQKLVTEKLIEHNSNVGLETVEFAEIIAYFSS